MKYKIVQRNIIQMGIQEKTFIIEADSQEEAKKLVENNDAEDFCIDIDYDIKKTEFLSLETEEY